MTRGTTWVRRLAVFVAAGLAAMLLFEFVARQIYWLPYIQHPRLSTILPGGTIARFCREGCADSTWVADGLRRQAPPDPSAPSLLVLGDSFTEALMIDDERVFSRGIERALEAGGRPMQVLNMGRSGMSTAHYVALADFYLERVKPRWTVVQLRWAGLEENAFQTAETHFRRVRGGGVEAVEVPPRTSKLNRYLTTIRQHSALAHLATTRIKEFASAAASRPPLFRGAWAAEAPASVPPSHPVAEQLEAVVRAFDGRVTLFLIPPFDATDPAAVGATERDFDAACATRGWSCVSLRAAFPAFAARHEAPAGFSNTRFNWGHMNDAGHVAAGELIGAELLRLRTRDLF